MNSLSNRPVSQLAYNNNNGKLQCLQKNSPLLNFSNNSDEFAENSLAINSQNLNNLNDVTNSICSSRISLSK